MAHQETGAERLLTEAEVADRLSVKRQTLQAWRARGHGPGFIKVGAAVRYSSAAVAAWLATRTVTPRVGRGGVAL
ncbi:helix-turn-helix domain-containing protein [Methylobacterium durans]|uniref:helix-turn-helix transcriptional regulator n=1 Tax=Methylobacterium durans TaxID=2202825 RepID=UPI002AFED3BE|nr:helix-turn-helix domain-containing protein [Methylobacterium durans]MEA1835180.1 helix-turn-helix domain-containing protein [Methylobacterium durans]